MRCAWRTRGPPSPRPPARIDHSNHNRRFPMSIRKLLIATTTAAVLASGGAAAAADAPIVSAQHTVTGRAPLTVPGTGVKAGITLPTGARLVYRRVTIERGQPARLVLRAPAGK